MEEDVNKERVACKRMYTVEQKEKIRAQQAKYKAEHKDGIRAKRIQYYARHKEEIQAKRIQHNIKHKDEIRAKQMQYNAKVKIQAKQMKHNAEHKEEKREKRIQYNIKHKDEIRAKQMQYNAEHKDKIQAKQMKHNAERKEEIRAKQTKYDHEHKDEIRAKRMKYYAEHKDEIRAKRMKYSAVHKQNTQTGNKGIKKSGKHNQNEAHHRKTSNLKKTLIQRKSQKLFNRRYRLQMIQQVKQRMYERRLMKLILGRKQVSNGRKETKATRTTQILHKLTVQRLIRTCMILQRRAMRKFSHEAILFKQKMQVFMTQIPDQVNANTLTDFLGGQKNHTNHSEPYFADTAYNLYTSHDKQLVVDETGTIHNIHIVKPLSGSSDKGKEWTCAETCNIRQTTIDKVKGFVQLIATSNKQDLLTTFQNIDICTNKDSNSTRLGHSITCIENPNCQSSLRCLRELGCHYSSVRCITKSVYTIKRFTETITQLQKALSTGDIEDIEFAIQIAKLILDKQGPAEESNNNNNQIRPDTDEAELMIKNRKGLLQCHIDINNFHDTPCACCERLYQRSNLTLLTKLTNISQFDNAAWLQLQAYWLTKYTDSNTSDQDLYETLYICKYCKDSLNKSIIPSRCALNGLGVDDIPDTIKTLNLFETMLLQKAKCFQTVLRLGPIKQRLPPSAMLKSVKGRVIYLPLPLQENNDMLPEKLAPNHELHILVNGVPTKDKVIWQNIVSIDKIKNAMDTLKVINPLYQNLSSSTADIENYILNSSEQHSLVVEQDQSNDSTHEIMLQSSFDTHEVNPPEIITTNICQDFREKTASDKPNIREIITQNTASDIHENMRLPEIITTNIMTDIYENISPPEIITTNIMPDIHGNISLPEIVTTDIGQGFHGETASDEQSLHEIITENIASDIHENIRLPEIITTNIMTDIYENISPPEIITTNIMPEIYENISHPEIIATNIAPDICETTASDKQNHPEILSTHIITEINQTPEIQPGPDALLEKLTNTQITHVYEHYSIHPIHADQPSKQINMYRMKECSGKPLNIWDTKLDLMCFPDLFPNGRYGKYEPTRKMRVTDADYRVSRLSNMDGRFRRNQQYLFHLLYDCDIKNLSSSINHMLRQSKPGTVTVEEMMKEIESGDRQLENNLSSLFGNIRGTRQYWYSRQGEVNCLMREFGPPTWFLTLSCAEYAWENLYEHLLNINSDLPGVNNMTPGELCSSDPVTVCRHYHTRFHSILHNLILCKDNPVLGHVEHYFWRVEYQMRGAPHIHMLLWIKDAPLIGKDSSATILTFIQTYITCAIPNEITSPTLNKYVTTFQKHKCSSYCQRKFKTDAGKFYIHCRFGFPRSERKAAILHDAFSSMRHRQKGKSSKRLYELPRTSSESFINDYNPSLSLALGANVDVQYIGESSWSLAKYVTAYVTKSEKVEMEVLWKELTHKSLSSRLWSLGLKALTHRQCGSYEAADRLLGTHLYGKSESIRFINTNQPEKRNRILKTFKQLEEMKETNPDSEDIYLNNYIDTYYPNRPEKLESTSLYDFMTTFDRLPPVKEPSPNMLVLKNDLGILRKRSKPYVINHIQHNPKKSDDDKEKYYHALLMLFLPWRDELELIGGCKLYENQFLQMKDSLQDMMKHHSKLLQIIEAEETARKKIVNDTPPSSQTHTDQQQEDCENAMRGHEVNETEHAMSDIATALRSRHSVSIEAINKGIENLNDDQLRIFKKVKTNIEDNSLNNLKMFVSGSGGTGKSYLIKTISQWLCGPDDTESELVTVAVTAPTGLAAYNIGGFTIHRLLMLPIEHGTTAKYEKLSSESLSIVKNTLSHLKLLIIDEISMVSSVLLTYIHLRLCEITGQQAYFGGINILLFGDLLQLPPVKGSAPFIELSSQEIQSKLESIGSVNLWETLEYDELTINVRQSADSIYSDLLSRVRVGDPTPDDITLLQTHLIIQENDESIPNLYQKLLDEGQNPVCLLSKVDACQQMNEKMLDKLGVLIVTIPSIDEIDGITSTKTAQIANTKLRQLKSDASRTAGLESELKVGIGARVMLRRNMDMEAGLVNGSIGSITSFEYSKSQQIYELNILFDNGRQTKLQRFTVPFELMKGIYVHRKQFPISLAYAITVHKCQGLSLQCAIVDIGKSIFGPGMAYVALSRVTSISGLYLIDLCGSKIQADNKSIVEYNRLRSKFRPDLPQLKMSNKHREPLSTINYIFTATEQPREVNEQYINLLSHDHRLLLTNQDKVSCYANSVLQLLLHVPQFKTLINSSNINGPATLQLQHLQTITNNNRSVHSALNVRASVNERYLLNNQQDAVEFLVDLLDQLQTEGVPLKELITGVEGVHERCTRQPHCLYSTTTGHDQFEILRLSFPDDKPTNITFKSMLEQWCSFDNICQICGSTLERRTIVRYLPQFLFISLNIFHSANLRSSRPVTGYVSNNVMIAGTRYHTIGAICHAGNTIHSGHYWCLLKDQSNWLNVNDTKIRTQTRFVNNLNNVYLLLLEKSNCLHGNNNFEQGNGREQ